MKIRTAEELMKHFPNMGFEIVSSSAQKNKRKMEITGKIIAVCESRGGTSAKTGNSWKMQEFVIETIEQYPRKCMFSVFGEDRLKEFNIQQGETLTVHFDIDAREYNGRWYNDIRAWKVVRANPTPAPQQNSNDFEPPF